MATAGAHGISDLFPLHDECGRPARSAKEIAISVGGLTAHFAWPGDRGAQMLQRACAMPTEAIGVHTPEAFTTRFYVAHTMGLHGHELPVRSLADCVRLHSTMQLLEAICPLRSAQVQGGVCELTLQMERLDLRLFSTAQLADVMAEGSKRLLRADNARPAIGLSPSPKRYAPSGVAVIITPPPGSSPAVAVEQADNTVAAKTVVCKTKTAAHAFWEHRARTVNALTAARAAARVERYGLALRTGPTSLRRVTRIAVATKP